VLSKQESTTENNALYSPEGLILAKGYVRVITLKPTAAKKHGGPFAEFIPEQIAWDNFHPIPNPCPYCPTSWHKFFYEYRSNDAANIMLYIQRRRVRYAPYIIGRCYIGIADLRTVVQPLKAKAAA
jgi:hypothetical protein